MRIRKPYTHSSLLHTLRKHHMTTQHTAHTNTSTHKYTTHKHAHAKTSPYTYITNAFAARERH